MSSEIEGSVAAIAPQHAAARRLADAGGTDRLAEIVAGMAALSDALDGLPENTSDTGHASTGTRGHGEMGTWGHGDTGTRGHGDTGTRGNGDTGTRGHGDR
jgi:hypothetical protein